MKHHRRTSAGADPFIDDIRRSQRNVVWPDPVVNSRSVDEFLWKGSASPTLVQRIGAWLFGVSLIGPGAGCVIVAIALSRQDGDYLGPLALGSFGALGVAFGLKTISSAFGKRLR